MQREKIGYLMKLRMVEFHSEDEFVIVVESIADFNIASTLVERLLMREIDWVDEENLQYLFCWSGLQSEESYTCWKDLSKVLIDFEQKGIRLPRFLGHSKDGQRFKADGAPALKILNLVRILQKNRRINAVFLIRDLDNQPRRKEGLEQARSEHVGREPKLAVVIGTANPKREAWVLNGFVPINEEETRILEELKKQLEFDPCEEAERLREQSNDEPARIRNSKFVLSKLVRDNLDREQQCWQETDLELLKKRGSNTGIVDFFDEIIVRLVPIFTKPD